MTIHANELTIRGALALPSRVDLFSATRLGKLVLVPHFSCWCLYEQLGALPLALNNSKGPLLDGNKGHD